MNSSQLSIESILYQMSLSERAHLVILKGFLLKNPQSLTALREKNWQKFALHYNGIGYKENQYDVIIEKIYKDLKERK